jgi:serpin B
MSYSPADDGRGEVRGVAPALRKWSILLFAVQSKTDQSPRDWLSGQNADTLFADIAAFMAQKSNFTVSWLCQIQSGFEDSLLNELDTLAWHRLGWRPADFSRLSASRAKGLSSVKSAQDLYLGRRKGTEAAAATSVAIDESMPAYDVEMVFDQPFLYGIMDLKTGIPLFVGILENPQAIG